jgi:hypothetical protein
MKISHYDITCDFPCRNLCSAGVLKSEENIKYEFSSDYNNNFLTSEKTCRPEMWLSREKGRTNKMHIMCCGKCSNFSFNFSTKLSNEEEKDLRGEEKKIQFKLRVLNGQIKMKTLKLSWP